MIVLEDDVLQNIAIPEEQLRMEIGAILYEKSAYSLRRTARIVGVDWMKLQAFLGDKGISTYAEELFSRDLEFGKDFRK